MRAMSLLFVFTAGCKCLPVPVTDPTPPGAGVTVEYRPAAGGARVTRTLGVGEADITVDADRNDVVAVLYTGGDNQGLRKIELLYDMSYSTGTSIVQPLLAAIQVTANCPRNPLLDSHNFNGDGHPWRYTFAARSENWLGAVATSGTITVRRQ